ncbi:MAG: hypothetical protein V7L21_29510 [Nostoc sp.]|uniref:hypothetical protein n=1 Tax=Nostoc sp. TaxID=1180 RepID=UPI002FF61CEE
MPQPAIIDLFGTGSAYASGNLSIPLSALNAAGLSNNSPTALEIFAAIIKTGHTWLNSNTDTTVMATSDLTSVAPITRNSTAKTQFQYAVKFYGPYNAPEFDPDNI